jgi:PHD/YefM family antitoxin component YafN of YafNO toxin-antitoxin module
MYLMFEKYLLSLCRFIIHFGTYLKVKIMLVVSTREFRQNQKNYLDQIDEGNQIVIQRGKNKCYKVSSVAEDDTLMSKEALLKKIDRAMQQYKDGNYKELTPEFRQQLFGDL